MYSYTFAIFYSFKNFRGFFLILLLYFISNPRLINALSYEGYTCTKFFSLLAVSLWYSGSLFGFCASIHFSYLRQFTTHVANLLSLLHCLVLAWPRTTFALTLCVLIVLTVQGSWHKLLYQMLFGKISTWGVALFTWDIYFCYLD